MGEVASQFFFKTIRAMILSLGRPTMLILHRTPRFPSPILNRIHNLSSFQKIIRELDEALELIETAMALIEQYDLGPRQFVVQSLRWADILRYRSEFGEAEEIFRGLVEVCQQVKEVREYEDFVYQHLGKLNFDLEDFEEASKFFKKALNIRRKKGDVSLIESTELAILRTKERLQIKS